MVVLVTVSSFHLTVQFVTVNANYMTAEAECHLDYAWSFTTQYKTAHVPENYKIHRCCIC